MLNPGQIKATYTIIETKWGYFGIVGTEKGLYRTHLPLSNSKLLKEKLLENLPDAKYDKWLFNPVAQIIIAYFNGSYINFDRSIPLAIEGFDDFAAAVLDACRDIKYGQTESYKQLAKQIRKPKTIRAIGRIMAINPLPLIIPCHRVIRSDGSIGGFSAAGGVEMKQKMLELEQKVIESRSFQPKTKKYT
ncbi:MAG: methylated-DNA--[protein]-cysteine S-methyltransferase [Planctomycetota bacterium]|jgi:methylated-DNA-[protein]-cysteine S-methyltransferase